MKILITIPHVFSPKKGSLYSSEKMNKKETKEKGLIEATLGNRDRHSSMSWIHASLGKGREVVTRQITGIEQCKIDIQIYTCKNESLLGSINGDIRDLKVVYCDEKAPREVPGIASRRTLMQAEDYDIVCYMEDDILIEDREFFLKLQHLVDRFGDGYSFIPHRCELMKGQGEVVLSGDPDGGRDDLFWDTGETLTLDWPLGKKSFYRATNPHSGMYCLTRRQALRVCRHWEERDWKSSFVLSGPLEQAGSGMLLPVLKIMKTVPRDYRFFMVRHCDSLWKRHRFE